MSFGSTLLDRIRSQKLTVSNTFEPIFKAYEDLFESLTLIKIKQEKFLLQRQRTESLDSLSSNAATNSSNSTNFSNQKIYELQKELNDLYRTKNENAQGLIDSNKKLESKELECVTLKRKLEEAEGKIVCLNRTTAALHDQISALQETNNFWKDEYSVLQTSFTVLENKVKELQEENQKMCSSVLQMKSKEADVMNMENMWQQKLREMNLKNQLAEAAKENAPVSPATSTHRQKCSIGAQEFDFVLLKHNQTVLPRGYCIASNLPMSLKFKFDAHDSDVNAIKWSRSGKYFATGGADRRIKLWNLDEEIPLCQTKLEGCNLTVNCLDFDMNEEHLVCGSNDFAVRLFSLQTSRSLLVFNGHTNKVCTVKFIGSSGRLVSGSHDRTLKIWDVRTKCSHKTFFVGSVCTDVVTNQGGPGANIISGHFDKKLRFWDIRYDRTINEILFNAKITSLDLSLDNNYLLFCSRDDILNELDLRMNKIIQSYSDDNFKVGLDYARCSYSPDRRYCSCGGADGCVFVWDVANGKLETVLQKQHQLAVVATCWHPSGLELASCDRFKSVCIWE